MQRSLAVGAVLLALVGDAALAQTSQQQPRRAQAQAQTQAQPQRTQAQPQRSQTPAQPQAPTSTNPLAGGTGPLQIDADRLEVRDRDKQAIFTGNVVATRGEAMVRATVMTVFYEGDARPGGTAPQPPAAQQQPGGQQAQQIRRIEMTGPVFFCQRTQTARGDNAVYNRVDETLIMTGNVVLTDGPENVVMGGRLRVNLRTNQAQVEPDPARPNERIRMIMGREQAAQATPAAPPPAPARAARPGQPAPQRPC